MASRMLLRTGLNFPSVEVSSRSTPNTLTGPVSKICWYLVSHQFDDLILAAFYISNTMNPNSFNDFSQVNRFFQLDGEGSFCIPLDLAASNFTGLQNGQNITIQVSHGLLTMKSSADRLLNRCCMTEETATCSKYVFYLELFVIRYSCS